MATGLLLIVLGALCGGSLSACGYCASQLTVNRTRGTLAGPGVLPVYAAALAILVAGVCVLAYANAL